MFTSVSRKEWVWALVAALLVVSASSLPYIAGYRAQTPELRFGGAVVDRMDYSVHLSTIHLGAHGEWKYRFRFTSEEQPGAYLKLFYIAIGHASRLFNLSARAAYEAARWIFGLASLLAIYALAAQVFLSVTARRTAFLLAALGSGLGWFQLILGWQPDPNLSPIDFWLADGTVFFGLLVFPHFSATTAFLAGMLALALSDLHAPQWWKWAGIGLLGVLIQIIQPYGVALADAGLLAAVLAQGWLRKKVPWREILGLAAVGIAQIPLLAYNLVVFRSYPQWIKFVDQNVTLSPPFLYYVLGYGLLWPFALLGGLRAVRSLWRRQECPELTGLAAALSWAAAAMILAYLPWGLQRRFTHGYTVPLGILAAYGLSSVFPDLLRLAGWRQPKKIAALAAILLVAFSSLSSIYLVLGHMILLKSRPEGLFDPARIPAAIDWLESRSGFDDPLLGTEQTGFVIAERTGLLVFAAHPMETLDFERKRRQVKAFYAAQAQPGWLQQSGIRWVIYGPYEQALGKTPPAESDGLERVYDQDGVMIYRVKP